MWTHHRCPPYTARLQAGKPRRHRPTVPEAGRRCSTRMSRRRAPTRRCRHARPCPFPSAARWGNSRPPPRSARRCARPRTVLPRLPDSEAVATRPTRASVPGCRATPLPGTARGPVSPRLDGFPNSCRVSCGCSTVFAPPRLARLAHPGPEPTRIVALRQGLCHAMTLLRRDSRSAER